MVLLTPIYAPAVKISRATWTTWLLFTTVTTAGLLHYNFVCTCINSENVIVKHVVRQGIFHSRMLSCVGRNMQFFT